MALKDILVHLNDDKACRARVQTAANLARQHGAHLTGLYVCSLPHVPDLVSARLMEEIIEAQETAARENSESAEKMFGEIASAAGLSAEWRSLEGDTAAQLSLHGRYADLVVIGQHDPDAATAPWLSDLPDRLVLRIGRSVMVVPYVGSYPDVGKNILVAWDASRQASRAVNDALPFLERAEKVEVLAVNPEQGPDGHGEIPCADICQHLARHGANVQAGSATAPDMEVGNILLSRAADLGVDLLVMGAYGHRRLRELVLGGVTRHMLNHMTVPVLLSH
jgi:nucleotide-binding universal stress UspA family protein